MDGRGRQVEGHVGIGPFKEGDSISLECHVPGGKAVILTIYKSIYCIQYILLGRTIKFPWDSSLLFPGRTLGSIIKLFIPLGFI